MNRKNLYVWAILACVASAAASLLLGAAALNQTIFLLIRLPRTVGCLLSGAALAAAGCVIQGVLSNPLASPGIIGVNAGAGLAVTVCCALGAVSGWTIAGASFLGGLGAVVLVALCAEKAGASRTTVILGGVAVNTFLGGLRDAVTNLFPDSGVLSSDFRVGGFSAVAHTRLIPAGILIIAALGLLLTLRSELDVMTLGEETAQGLGLNVKRMRLVFLTLSALLTGASVSYAGLLGFVGLMVPHMVRKAAGTAARHLLPLCMLFGAAFVTVCDILARVLFAPYELPVGIFLSVLGGPFFLWLLYKRKGGRGND
jgi:iron complex transport system permease protein